MGKEKVTYRLYALRVNSKSIEAAGGERFHRVTPDYVLIYTDKGQPENSVEITKDEVGRLTDGDSEWLLGCNVVIINEETVNNIEDIKDSLSAKVEQLEEALAKEKAKLNGRKNQSNE